MSDDTKQQNSDETAKAGAVVDESKDESPLLSMTQAQFNKLMGERAARAKRVGTEEILTAVGVTDEKELRAIIEQYRKAKAAEQSETEKLAAKLAEEQSKATAIQADYDGLLIKNALLQAAADPKYNLNNSAREALIKLIDYNTVSIEDGTVKGIPEAIEAAIKAYPILQSKERAGDGLGTPPVKRDVPAKLTSPEERKQPKRFIAPL